MVNPLETEEFKELCRKSTAKWGADAQFVVAIEEASEFQKAITKYLRCKGVLERNMRLRPNLIQEMADLLIMIAQVGFMEDIPREVLDTVIQLKINKWRRQVE